MNNERTCSRLGAKVRRICTKCNHFCASTQANRLFFAIFVPMNKLMASWRKTLAIAISIAAQMAGVFAQSAQVVFESDTFAVGKPVLLRMEITHPSHMTVIFPHQSAAFAPFELIAIEATPTRTRGGQSLDVAHYRVSSFEIAQEQRVSLIWKYINENGDTVPQLAVSQPIKLQLRTTSADMDLRRQTSPVTLQDDPDYFIIGLIITVAILAMVAGLWMLRRPVARYIRQRGVRQEWKAIRAELQRISQQKTAAAYLDGLNILWKEYLHFGTRQPLRSFTTTELQPLLQKQASLSAAQRQTLLHVAQLTDKVIYAGAKEPSAAELSSLHAEVTAILRAAYQQKKAAIQ